MFCKSDKKRIQKKYNHESGFFEDLDDIRGHVTKTKDNKINNCSISSKISYNCGNKSATIKGGSNMDSLKPTAKTKHNKELQSRRQKLNFIKEGIGKSKLYSTRTKRYNNRLDSNDFNKYDPKTNKTTRTGASRRHKKFVDSKTKIDNDQIIEPDASKIKKLSVFDQSHTRDVNERSNSSSEDKNLPAKQLDNVHSHDEDRIDCSQSVIKLQINAYDSESRNNLTLSNEDDGGNKLETDIICSLGNEKFRSFSDSAKQNSENGNINFRNFTDGSTSCVPKVKDEKSDSVVYTGSYTHYDLEIEEISRIRSNFNIPNEDKVDITHFDLLKVLGTGAYGKVFLVRKKGGSDHGRLYAMKVLKKATIVQKKKTAEHTRTERQVLEAVRRCPFLVGMHYAFQTDAKLHLILDYVSGGELFTHLYQREHFSESEVRIYIAEVVLALEQLHKLGIIYRDIKLENILLDAGGHIVLTDFGLSKELLPGINERAYSFCGTIEYMAPEVVKGGTFGHDIAVDWWSVGVLTYELLTGASPFTVEGERNTQQDISRRILKTQPPIPEHLGNDVKDFILKLLVKDPRRRLGGGRSDAIEIKSHSFFRKINWELLAKKQIPAPFIPKIKNDLDTSNFSDEFTKLPVSDTPAVVPPNPERLFRGYSYVSPSILMSKHTSPAKILHVDNNLQRPDPINIYRYHIKGSSFFHKYDLISPKPIGDGSFSIVMQCCRRSTKEMFAVKILNISHDSHDEIKTLESCQGHPNIVKLIEVVEDEAYTYIITELLEGGELLDRRTSVKYTEDKAYVYFTQIVNAVAFIHSKNIAHRDLKPENILFQSKSSDCLKIVDFGFAKFLESSIGIATPCFTLDYAAPEVLLGSNKTYTEACDLWALGVILYTLVCDQPPFSPKNKCSSEKNIEIIIDRIQRGSFDTRSETWHKVSKSTKTLVRGLLSVDITKRITMHQLKQHEHLKYCRDNILSTTFCTVKIPSNPTQQMVNLGNTVHDTNNAFHQAQKQRFCLQNGNNANLSHKRGPNKSSSTNSSVSDDTSALRRSKSSSGIALSDQNNRSISINSDVEIVAVYNNTNDKKENISNKNINKVQSKNNNSDQIYIISDDSNDTLDILQLQSKPKSSPSNSIHNTQIKGFKETSHNEINLIRTGGICSKNINNTDEFYGFDDNDLNKISNCLLILSKYNQTKKPTTAISEIRKKPGRPRTIKISNDETIDFMETIQKIRQLINFNTGERNTNPPMMSSKKKKTKKLIANLKEVNNNVLIASTKQPIKIGPITRGYKRRQELEDRMDLFISNFKKRAK